MDPADVKPLTGNAKELERLNKQHRESYNGLFQETNDQQWFLNDTKWVSYSAKNIQDDIHLVAEMSVKDEMMKSDPERAENFAFISEWDLYEGV